MAKDTEKLIRQLSLISYLMAERRPVTALEIRRDVEGYSGMNEDAFARRFYADRSELESLRIQLTVERPTDGAAEQENYSLRPENFHLPPIAFSDEELAALQTALSLLDGEFAYAEPLRLALQQITWGRPSPLRAPEQRSVGARHHGVRRRPRALGAPGEGRDGDLPQQDDRVRLLHDGARRDRLAPRRPLPPAVPGRPVLPARVRARAQGDPRVPALAHPRQGLLRDQGRARLPPARGLRPARLRPPRGLAARRSGGRAEVLISARIAWQVERHFGRYGEIRAIRFAPAKSTGAGAGAEDEADAGADARAALLQAANASEGDVVFTTGYSSPRTIVAWVLGLGANARLLGPDVLTHELGRRLELLWERHGEGALDDESRPAAGEGILDGRREPIGQGAPGERARSSSRARGGRRRAGAEDGEEDAGARERHRDPSRALRAPGHAREHPDPGRARRRARVDRGGLRAAADQRARSCTRTSTC